MFGIQKKNPQKWVYIDNTGKMRLVSARCFFMGKRREIKEILQLNQKCGFLKENHDPGNC